MSVCPRDRCIFFNHCVLIQRPLRKTCDSVAAGCSTFLTGWNRTLHVLAYRSLFAQKTCLPHKGLMRAQRLNHAVNVPTKTVSYKPLRGSVEPPNWNSKFLWMCHQRRRLIQYEMWVAGIKMQSCYKTAIVNYINSIKIPWKSGGKTTEFTVMKET